MDGIGPDFWKYENQWETDAVRATHVGRVNKLQGHWRQLKYVWNSLMQLAEVHRFSTPLMAGRVDAILQILPPRAWVREKEVVFNKYKMGIRRITIVANV